MMLDLICVGRLKASWCREGCAMYESRLRRLVHLHIQEFPASKAATPQRQRDEESIRILRSIEKIQGVVWVLDERGDRLTSVLFAAALRSHSDHGQKITVLLGGAYGFNDAVRKAARRIIRLSDMTFPHELCRVLFLEQLYRAAEILRGSGYHH